VSAVRAPRSLQPAELVRRLQAGQRAPFYLLFGEEEYERERATAWLIGQLAPAAAREFNLDVFRADDAAPEAIVEAYNTFPLSAAHRLIVVRCCEQLSAEACHALEPIVERPMATSVLIAAGGKVDLRRRFFQRLASAGWAVAFATPYAERLPQWVRQQARRAGARIDPRAADMLSLLVGRNLRELATEIAKASAYVGADGVITPEVVQALAGGDGRTSVFALADAVGAGDRQQALALLRRLLAAGEEPARIMGLLSRHFQLLLKARRAVAQGTTGRDALAAALGVSPFFAGNYAEQARVADAERLWSALVALRDADAQVKSGRARHWPAVLELLILQLCAGGGRAER